MAKITMYKTHSSGIALGGIGSGTVELLPDGEFHYWQIANPPRFTTVSWEKKVDDGEGSTGALSFWVRSQTPGGKPVVRKLGMKTDADDFTYRMFAWNKPVEQIDFDGRFPVCDLVYKDRGLPCNVNLQAVAPFVPHNSDAAATPGFYLDFTVENPTDEPMEISLMGALEPNFANSEGCSNTLVRDAGMVGVYMQPAMQTDAPNCGNLCLSVAGDGELGYITGEFWRYLREYVHYSDFGVSQESFLFDFREFGCLPNSEVGCRPETIPACISDLKDEKIDRLFDLYGQYPFVQSLLKRIRHIEPDFPKGREDRESFLRCVSQQIDRMGGGEFGSCALCSKTVLSPGEKTSVRFVLSWYFPNHFGAYGNRLGHYYENLFADALEVNRYLQNNRALVHDRAVALAQLLYRTDMPEAYPDAWSAHLATIVKCSWYLKDGKFGLWEGLGYCGFHTTDITYHASFGLLALFPDLQLKQMRMGAAFQREDGRVHHFFTPDLEHVDDGFDRVDMNMQFVLMVLRDYLFTGDRSYLTDLWDNVKRAMDSIQSLDADDDGLPDQETKRNTYDAWNFSGTPTYISVLWLAALKAAALIADRMGDTGRAEDWRKLLETGLASLEEKLWNGEYYNLWRKETETDESLMSDQLDGEWFLRAMGIGGNLSDERVRDVIRMIYQYNFDPEAGLINASCPEGRKTTIFTYKNCQAGAVWTGIGYAMAATCLSVGLPEIADMEVQSIHANQMRMGAFWDHWECGHHYTRPMSSWSTINTALGLYVDYESRTIGLHPALPNVTLPLCLRDVLATVSFHEGECYINCYEGDLSGWNVIVEY